MRVEHSEHLLAVGWIIGVIDVEHDTVGDARPAAAEQIDEAEPDLHRHAAVGKVLQSRQCRLAHQVGTALGRATARQLQRRIGA